MKDPIPKRFYIETYVGCTLRCPFCHNPELVTEEAEETDSTDQQDLMSFLKKRKGKLDGIVFTGGEPLVHADRLIPLLEKIRNVGLLIKIDSNGTLPKQLNEIATRGLVDFIAMDFKTAPEKYDTMGASSSQVEKIMKSLSFIVSSAIPYEIRTTVVPGLHTGNTLRAMLPHLRKVKTYVLQNFEPNGTIDPEYGKRRSFTPEEMATFLRTVRRRLPSAELRNT